MSSCEYSAESIKIEKLATCFKALIGIIDPEDIAFAEEFLSDQTFHGAKEIAEKLETLQSFEKDLIFRFKTKNGNVINITFLRRYRLIILIISGAENQFEQKLSDLIEKFLELKKPTDIDIRSDASEENIYKLLWNVYDDIQSIKAEILSLNQKIIDEKSKLSTFVSFRFDDHSKSLAFELREFLDKVNVNFISGIGYEPRSVSEKVLEKLSSPLDLFIIIYSTTGESAWLHQEIGVAKGRNLPIIILVEEGADWNKGLLADNEYIEFQKGVISQSFIRLLEGISFLKQAK